MENNRTNNLPQLPLDHVTNDYMGYFELMKDAIPTLTPEWTDTSDTDQGIVLLQLFSYGLHLLSYYQERVMMENILELARTKKGILTGCNFLGYSPARQVASVGELTIVKDSDYATRDCVVPLGSKFSTNPKLGTPIIFETTEELVIPIGVSEGKVNIKQGITIPNEVVGVSSSKLNESFTISTPDVLVESLRVSTNENNMIQRWSIVDNFLDSTQIDRHFTISLDEEDRTVIRFGDGIFGRKPQPLLNIYASYRIGGGKMGDLAPNLITYVYDTENDLNFIDSVTNAEFTQGGSDYENLQLAKQRAPKHYRSRQQAVTPLDFRDIAELVEGVGKASCVETFVTTKVYLYIITDTFEVPNEALCKKVKDKVDSNRVGSVDLIVLPCEIIPFDIKCTVYVHDNFNKGNVQAEVNALLRETFNVSNFDFNDEFFANKVIDICFNVGGVKNVVLDQIVTLDKVSDKTQILKLRDVTVDLGGI